MLLELKNITFGFIKDKPLLKELSMSLEKGKIYALMGGNGSGKTTLFNMITGFLTCPEGSIYFDGKNITNKQPHLINRFGIGRTFQDLRIIRNLTVRENIIISMQNNPSDNILKAIMPRSFHFLSDTQLELRAGTIAVQFFLNEVQSSLAGEISYGQQKLLSLACCVANGASVLLLDEAVAGIQPDYRNKIVQLLKDLKSQGKTILVIEHNSEFIEAVADAIYFLNGGKIALFESMESLKKDKQVMESYI